MSTNEKQKPVHSVRIGRIEASLWKNESKKGAFHNVTLRRSYAVKGEGEKVDWRSTDSFGKNDLPLVQAVIDQALTWLLEHDVREHQESDENEG